MDTKTYILQYFYPLYLVLISVFPRRSRISKRTLSLKRPNPDEKTQNPSNCLTQLFFLP